MTSRLTEHRLAAIADPAQRARFYANRGYRLGNAGRRGEALALTRKAAGLYRGLVGVSPAADRPDLAMALNNLGAQMSQVGRRAEAVALTGEAADLYRELAAANPAADLPDLAAVEQPRRPAVAAGAAGRGPGPRRKQPTCTASWPRSTRPPTGPTSRRR